jgi:hypothetical protein
MGFANPESDFWFYMTLLTLGPSNAWFLASPRCAAMGLPRRASLDVVLGVAAAPSYGKPWIAFVRQKFTRSGFDERSNHLE